MKSIDLQQLYKLPIILKRNCRFCGTKFDVKHGSTKYCNGLCRNNFHNSLRKYPQLKVLAEFQIPLTLDWIKTSVDKILENYDSDRLNDVIEYKCVGCQCLVEFRDEIDYDFFFLVCDTCFVKMLIIIMSFDQRTKALVKDKL